MGTLRPILAAGVAAGVLGRDITPAMELERPPSPGPLTTNVSAGTTRRLAPRSAPPIEPGDAKVAGFVLAWWRAGAPEEIRTPDPQIRSLVLYPAELRALCTGAETKAHRAKDIPVRQSGYGCRHSYSVRPVLASRCRAPPLAIRTPARRSWQAPASHECVARTSSQRLSPARPGRPLTVRRWLGGHGGR
jgi:hypothetical protein